MTEAEKGDTKELAERIRLLEEQFELRDLVLSIISHDLKSPVSSIVGLLRLLLKSKSDNLTARQVEIIETLERSATAHMELVENIIELSRLLRGKIHLSPSLVDPAGLIAEITRRYEPLARDKNIDLVCERSDTVKVHVDIKMITRALGRIVTNSIWFTKPGGSVKMTAESVGSGHVAFVVVDTGVGIEQNRLKDIFDLNHRYFTLGTAEEKGTGFGLYLARANVALNGGELHIESGIGEGTTVRMVFPAHEQKVNTSDGVR